MHSQCGGGEDTVMGERQETSDTLVLALVTQPGHPREGRQGCSFGNWEPCQVETMHGQRFRSSAER